MTDYKHNLRMSYIIYELHLPNTVAADDAGVAVMVDIVDEEVVIFGGLEIISLTQKYRLLIYAWYYTYI